MDRFLIEFRSVILILTRVSFEKQALSNDALVTDVKESLSKPSYVLRVSKSLSLNYRSQNSQREYLKLYITVYFLKCIKKKKIKK